ncbi:MAG: amidohydrolase family protein, partial [Planctomycetota bacterium]
LDAGGKCLEHAFFLDEATIKRCAEEGIFVCPQTWGMSPELFSNPNVPEEKHEGIKAMQQQYANFPKWLLKHKVKVAYATDALGPFSDNTKSRRYELHWRCEYFGSNFEVLKQATSVAGELMALSGPRNPYKAGKLGVIEEGAYADILLVDGNPLEDITVLGGHPVWFSAPEPQPIDTINLIMKDGEIYKNTITGVTDRQLNPISTLAAAEVTPPAAGVYKYASRQAGMIRQLTELSRLGTAETSGGE